MSEKVKRYTNKDFLNGGLDNAELPPLRDDFIAKLENALMFMNFKHNNLFTGEHISNVSLKQFDAAWLIDISLNDDDNNQCFRPFTDLQVTPDIFPNLNFKLLNLSGELAVLDKIRFLNSKEKRHLSNFRYIYSHKSAVLNYGKQKWYTDETGYGFNKVQNDEQAKFITPIPTSLNSGYYLKTQDIQKYVNEALKDKESNYWHDFKTLHVVLQLSLSYYYEWSCIIRENENSLAIRIPINPSSSKAVFMFRDIPRGEQRRKAILNYVKDHYRTIKDYKGRERDILIKKHFRGELKFNWRGLEVQIKPSEYDINRIKTSKKFVDV